MSFTSLCATAIIGMLVARLNAWKSELSNTFQDPSPNLLPCTTAKAFLALARPTFIHNDFTNPPLFNIFLTMPNALLTTTTTNFLFSLEVALLFTFLAALEATFIKSFNPLLCKQI